MQHALLGLGIALILAIAAAIGAPAYIDWDDWRATFERQASALAGAPVRIRGRIEATILPTPAFLFRSVEIGDPDKGSGMRAGEARGILALGALLRGSVEAEEFVLVKPAMRVVVEPGRQSLAPAVGAAAAATDLVTFARIAIEDGSLVVADRASGEQQVFDRITASGEVRAKGGPMRVEASFRRDGGRWTLRANSATLSAENASRVHVTLERPADGAFFDADGNLIFADAAPRFEGKVTFARRGTEHFPWQLTANARATEQQVALDSFELTFGADAAATEVAGEIQIAPRRGGRIEGKLSARRIDLDLATGVQGAKPLRTALRPAGELAALLGGLPFQGRIGFNADAVMAGGGTLREVKAELALQDGAMALERLEARLPGRGSIRVGGAGAAAGTVTVEAEDAAALAAWAFGGTLALPAGMNEPVRLTGRADWSNRRLALRQIDLSLGAATLSGSVMLVPADGDRRAKLDVDLLGSGLDLDMFAPVAAALQDDSAAVDLALAFSGNRLQLLQQSVGRVDAALVRTADAVAIDRFTLEDFGGLSVRGKGRITAPFDRPSGKLDYEISATRPDGVALLLARAGGADAARLARHIAASGAVNLSGTASGAGSAAGVEFEASGRVGEIEAAIAASYDALSETLSEAHISLDARDAGQLIRLLGVTPGPPTPGDGSLEVDLSKPSDGAMLVAARLGVPGANVSAAGEIGRSADELLEPRLDLRVDASDLRPVLAAAARTPGSGPIPANGTARLTRNGEAFALDNIALDVAGARVRGALTAAGFEKAVLGGKLAVERMEAAGLLALVLGSAPSDGSFWPAVRLNPAPLGDATGTIELEVGALGLADRLAATAAKFKLNLNGTGAAIEDFSSDFAGGKFEGHARFVRGEGLGFDASVKLNSFQVARVLAPGTWQAGARGRGSLTLTVAGNGRTPAALVGSLAGQGTLALESLEIDGLDPAAVEAVFAAADKKDKPPDEIAVIAALAPAFAKGTLKLNQIEAPLVVAAGVARTGRVRAQTGAAEISATGNLDLARLAVEGAVEVEAPPLEGLTARPAATMRWKGPLAAPERGIEAAALATAITLRAMERETRRIEERDRAAPPRSEERAPEQPASPQEASLPPPATPSNAPAPTSDAAAQGQKAQARPRPPAPAQGSVQPLPPPINIRPAPIFPAQ